MRPIAWGVIALALAAAGCGSRTALGVDEPRGDAGHAVDAGLVVDAGIDAAKPDAGDTTPDGGPDATTPVGGCRWELGEPTLISQEDADPLLGLGRVASYRDGVVVGWQLRGTSSAPTQRFVRRLDGEAAPITPIREHLRAAITPNVSGGDFAVLGDDVAMLAWDLVTGCRFVRLGPTLDAATPDVTIFGSASNLLLATSEGFSFLHESPELIDSTNALVLLDRDGLRLSPVGVVLIDPADDPSGTRRVAMDDGAFLLAWQRRAPAPAVWLARVFSELGAPSSVGPDRVGTATDRIALFRGFDGAVVARIEETDAGLERVAFVVYDVVGMRVGDERELAFEEPSRVIAFDIVRYRERTILVWSERTSGGLVAFVQEIVASGARVGEIASFDVSPSEDEDVAIRADATATGLIVAYTEPASDDGRRVFARAVHCRE